MNTKLVTLDVSKSPPEMVMRFLISAIHMMGIHMISDTARTLSSNEQQYKTEYNNLLIEVNDAAHKIDAALDTVIDKNNSKLGVIVLAVLQIAVMAMSTYIDASQEHEEVATVTEQDEVLDMNDIEIDPMRDGVFIGGKGGDH